MGRLYRSRSAGGTNTQISIRTLAGGLPGKPWRSRQRLKLMPEAMIRTIPSEPVLAHRSRQRCCRRSRRLPILGRWPPERLAAVDVLRSIVLGF
jgi:hypothetical protein